MTEQINNLQDRLLSTIRNTETFRKGLHFSKLICYGCAVAYLIFIIINLFFINTEETWPDARQAGLAAIPLILLVITGSLGIKLLRKQFDMMEAATVKKIITQIFPDARCKIETAELYPSLINVSFFFGTFDKAFSVGEINIGNKLEIRDVIISNAHPEQGGPIATSIKKFFASGPETEPGSFRGLFANARLGKTIQGSLVILPDHLENRVDYLAKTLQSMRPIRSNHQLKTDEPEFERYFSIYTTNEMTARSILTDSIIQRIVELRKKYNRDIMLSFVGDLFFYAVSIPEGFLTRSNKSACRSDSVSDLYDNIITIKEIFKELKL